MPKASYIRLADAANCDLSLAAESSKTGASSSYLQILSSSALVGSSSGANIVIGIVRTKFMALLLGPADFGLFGLYGAILTLAQTVAALGVNSSGVRQIAAATASGEDGSIQCTALMVRCMSLITGLLGAVLLWCFARPVSLITFGSSARAPSVAMLGFAVLFSVIAGAQTALIQGLRKVSALVKSSVTGAFWGTVLSVLLVYIFRDKAVVPALIVTAAMMALASWWYSPSVRAPSAHMRIPELKHEVTGLVLLGLAFMSSGLLTMGVAYFTRIVVLRQCGYESAGLYQSAWTIGGLYAGVILQAMAADFYPRLTAVAADHATCNRLVNEQTEVGLLLAGPGVIGTLTFAPAILLLLYSTKFQPALAVLRWVCLGTTIQVITWPLGFVIVAKAQRSLFLGCELAYAVASTLLTWLCVRRFGLEGAGIAFCCSYVFHGSLVYLVVRRLSGFRWSRRSIRVGLIFLPTIAAVFLIVCVTPMSTAVWIGACAAAASAAYALRSLASLIGDERIPPPIRFVLRRCRAIS